MRPNKLQPEADDFMKQALLLSIAVLPCLHAQSPRPGMPGDTMTREKLAGIRDHAARHKQDMIAQTPPKASVSTSREQTPDLLSRSDILCYNGAFTIVPKRAILHQPKNIASRINQFIPGSKVMAWLDFLRNNRGWISTVEVTRAQAEGREAIDHKVIEHYRKSSNLVVATYKSGPISVLPLRKPEESDIQATHPNQQPSSP